MSTDTLVKRPPKDNLLRATFKGGVQLRSAGDAGVSGPVMTGHFVVFDEWTEIDSLLEGNFMERFAPGSVRKTIKENRDGMRVLFQHGFDPQIGDKPLGPIEDLREDEIGGFYAVPLLSAGYVRNEILPGLEEELYGASFRFSIVREEITELGISDYNPKGLPERTVKECKVPEFGPVTFPQYDGATAGCRSLRPYELVKGLAEDDRSVVQVTRTAEPDEAEAEKTSADKGEAEKAAPETAPAEAKAEDKTESEKGSEKAAPSRSSAGQPAHPGRGRRAIERPIKGSTSERPLNRPLG